MHKFNEKYLRSFTKVIAWRIIQTIVFTVSTYIITGNLTLGVQLAGLGLLINSGLYWAHERMWNSVDWCRTNNKNKIFSENQLRAISKMITWRILMLASVYIIAYVSTGNWKTSANITSTIILVNIFVYWLHERVWNNIKWGRQQVVI